MSVKGLGTKDSGLGSGLPSERGCIGREGYEKELNRYMRVKGGN